jgi:hypothetical protein
MNAKIFHLENQKLLADRLKNLLQRHVYGGMETTLVNADVTQGSDLARDYFKLLEAAVDPPSAVRFDVTTVEYMSQRLYIAYHYLWSGHLTPSSCFPAVSLEGRMVLVPAGLRRSISDRPLFRALERDGLAEIDFSDDASIEAAIVKIAENARTEAMRNLTTAASYMQFNGVLDLDALAKRAGVDVEYVQNMLRSAASGRVVYKQLRCDVQPRALPLGRWTKVELHIENHRDEDLRDMTISIRGPVRVRPESMVVNIDAISDVRIPVALLPEDRGEFPIELQLVLSGDRLLDRWLPVQYVWLSCDEKRAVLRTPVKRKTVQRPRSR